MRYQRITIHGQFLVHLATKGEVFHARCIQGLPEGTKFAYCIPDLVYGVHIVVEHESFPDLKDGDVIPLMGITPEFEKV